VKSGSAVEIKVLMEYNQNLLEKGVCYEKE